MTIKCLTVDDEELALDLLEDNIRKVPFLELAGRCSSAFEAMEMLNREEVDLMFLDIQMPDLNGIQMLQSLKRKPMVIFTTAYGHYAMEGFNLDVIDYLLKPYPFERFLKAVNKVRDLTEMQAKVKVTGETREQDVSAQFIFVRADYKLVKIALKDILYVEGLKDYIKIYTGAKPILTQMSMKAIEEKLPSGEFFRVHRSFIVAFDKIDFIQKHALSIGGREIPISESYRDQLFRIINHESTPEPE